jgi:hypothetical protein
MSLGFKKRAEIDLVSGRQGIGIVSAVSGNTITLQETEYCAGPWAGSEGAKVAIFPSRDFQGVGTETPRSSLETGNFYTVESVDVDRGARTVKMTRTVDGAVAANDIIYFDGQRSQTGTWNIPVGIRDILQFTTGDLFGISAGAYSLWKPTTKAAVGPLTFALVQDHIVDAINKGLEEDLCLFINPIVWADLLNAETAVRQWNKKQNRYEVGGEEIAFYSQHGTVKIIPSMYVPETDGIYIAPDLWSRVGATDMTFNLPGRGDEFFLHLDDNAGYELRAYDNCAPFTEAPGKAVIATGITA